MSSWSSRRKTIYGAVFFLIMLGVFALIFYTLFYEKPTCFDGKKNGNEEGADCGGACSKVCEFTINPPGVVWVRAFLMSPGIYSATAYIQNPNLRAEAFDVPYVFRFFDADNILVYERKGRMDILPQRSFAIFETDIRTGDREIRYAFLEFEKGPEWRVVKSSENSENSLRLKTQDFSSAKSLSKLQIIMQNTSVEEIRDIELVAILYDSKGNAMASSRTFLDVIASEGEEEAVFTWPMELVGVSRVEVIPTIIR